MSNALVIGWRSSFFSILFVKFLNAKGNPILAFSASEDTMGPKPWHVEFGHE